MTVEVAGNKEQLSFQAEVKQLLHLMVHSLYSNKEIFLRELISNASDACDKLRFEALTDSALFESDSELRIRVRFDATARTITVADNGIGMSRQEVIDNIGTIAKSGTREFFNQLTGDAQKDAHLIGQFGVGFYSAFIVADKVTLTTRRAGLTPEHGVRWESDGAGAYTLEMINKPTRGTEITLHLKESESELLNDWRLKSIITKYSDHIQIPILMPKAADAQDKAATETEETVNRASALWARPKNEISKEQYDEFYKHVAHDFEPPLAYVHTKVEGKQEFTQLLYIPARAPFDLWDRQRRHGIKLYVRRVFIMDDAEQLMPAYLRFVRGVVDSNDLPLNVSREILQQSKDVEAIRAGCVKRVLGMLEDLATNEKDKYATFWNEFGRAFKEGMGEDYANRERIAKLLRFASTANAGDEQNVSLADYVSRMQSGQEKIYYLTADSHAAARNSPHLEVFRKKDVEVLLLHEPVDEWLIAHLNEFDGKTLQSVAKGELDLGKLEGDEEKKIKETLAAESREVSAKIKQALGDKIKDVRASHRLTDSPACLVVEAHELSGNLERLLKAAGQTVKHSAPILEINPNHPILARMKGEMNAAQFNDWSLLLYDQSVIAEGGELEDPAGFVKRLNDLLVSLALR